MRLKQVAEEMLESKRSRGLPIPDAYGWLMGNDLLYVLRRRGVKHDHRLAHDESGRKLRDHYLPHIPIDAQVYARTWKALKWTSRTFAMTTSEAWEKVILPEIEGAIKKFKEGGK